MSQLVRMKVEMGCPSCEAKVDSAVREACSAADDIDVDHAKGEVSYQCPHPEHVQAVADSIRKAGYEVTVVEPS